MQALGACCPRRPDEYHLNSEDSTYPPCPKNVVHFALGIAHMRCNLYSKYAQNKSVPFFALQLLCGSLLVFLVGACGTSSHPHDQQGPALIRDPTDGSVLYADVVRYVDLGLHRTGYPGDVRTAEWIRAELSDVGFEATLLPWELNQVFLEEVALTVGGQPFDAFPAWYPKLTGPAPLRAELAPFNPRGASGYLQGKVAYIPLWRVLFADLTEGGICEYAAEAASHGAIGLCVPITSLAPDSGLVKAGNVRVNRQEPQPIPTLFVAPKDDLALGIAALTGSEVCLTIDG
jgi:hypothetical protein